MGSVARHVAWHSTTPVLILRESDQTLSSLLPGHGHSIRALVALDGTPFTEAAITPAAEVVAACSTPARGELQLTRLVLLPSPEDELAYERLGLDINLRQAALYQAGQYLQAVRERLSHEAVVASGVDINWSVEECNDVAETLIKIAQGKGIGTHMTSDLIVLTTHGRTGVERWVRGSATELVLNSTTLPLLIVHPHKSKPSFAALTDKSEQLTVS
ncbi:MAG TPA: universal stress protein [Ktedonosporobacter sp.]|nr:universal stress protein [Ktedonosporobacter sp.]